MSYVKSRCLWYRNSKTCEMLSPEVTFVLNLYQSWNIFMKHSLPVIVPDVQIKQHSRWQTYLLPPMSLTTPSHLHHLLPIHSPFASVLSVCLSSVIISVCLQHRHRCHTNMLTHIQRLWIAHQMMQLIGTC